MLQIISGKFYTAELRRSNLLRGTLYTNMRVPWGCDVIETVAGRLMPSTTFSGLRTLSYEVQEEYEGAPEVGAMVSIGVDYFLKDFSAIVSFALNVICTPDPDLLRRLVGNQHLSPNVSRSPDKYISRIFDADVQLNEVELEQLKNTLSEIISLKREQYVTVLGAIRTYMTGLYRIGDDIDVAYTLLVASIESLSRSEIVDIPSWEDYDFKKRSAVDAALIGASTEVSENVRAALLRSEHAGLSRRFKSFVMKNLRPSFFREEVIGQVRPIGRSDLNEAISQAYAIRSKYVHTLSPVPKQVLHVWDLGEVAYYEGRPVLTLQGLVRVARHLIFSFIQNGDKVDQEVYSYSRDFPNIVEVELAAQHWVAGYVGFTADQARQKLSGLLEITLEMHCNPANPVMIDIRDLLKKYEAIIPGENSTMRLAMVAAYVLFHAVVPKEYGLANSKKVINRYVKLLAQPSLEAAALHLALLKGIDWSAADISRLYGEYYKQKYKKKSLKFPALYESAFALCLVEAHRKEGNLRAAIEAIEGALEEQPTVIAIQTARKQLTEHGDIALNWVNLLLPNLIEPKEKQN